jgi:opacity protein-like surface antigen
VVAASGGLLHFDRNVPLSGRKLNLSFDFGAGLRVGMSPSVGLRLDYRYHHISNGYTAAFNPGFDSNLLIVGVSVRRN